MWLALWLSWLKCLSSKQEITGSNLVRASFYINVHVYFCTALKHHECILCYAQSEEEKLAMERKVQLAEQAATILHSSLHHDYEREEPSRGSGGGGLNGEEEGLSPSSVGGPIITDTTTSTSTTSVS